MSCKYEIVLKISHIVIDEKDFKNPFIFEASAMQVFFSPSPSPISKKSQEGK